MQNDNAYFTGWLEDTTTFYGNDGKDITLGYFGNVNSTGETKTIVTSLPLARMSV